MKFLIWTAFALLAIFWTGTALISVELTEWLATTVGTSQVTDVAASVGQWPVPAWLALWVDPAWIEAIQASWLQVMGWLGASGPAALGSVLSWLIPLIWVVWGVVLLLMLLAATAGHFLVGRFARPAGQPAVRT
jgi:hypothetical protein